MPVFLAHIPAGRFDGGAKRALADALNRSLVEALGVPPEDRLIMLGEHGPDELFLHPTFFGMERDPASAMIVTVLIGAHRPFEDKRKPVAAINRLIADAVDVSPDDVFITLVPVPKENFSLGRGELQLADGSPRR